MKKKEQKQNLCQVVMCSQFRARAPSLFQIEQKRVLLCIDRHHAYIYSIPATHSCRQRRVYIHTQTIHRLISIISEWRESSLCTVSF